jgi:hypothetical protein
MRKEGWHVEVRTHMSSRVILNLQYISIIGMHDSAYGDRFLTRLSIPISPDRPIEVRILKPSATLHLKFILG